MKVPCRLCETMILPSTSDRTGGLCMPCATSKKDTGKDAEREASGFNMEVEDTFFLDGGCFVVFGTVKGGIIKVGDEIEIVTKDGQHMPAFVEALESHRKLIEKASSGEHVAVNIRNRATSGKSLKHNIQRGDLLYIAGEVLAEPPGAPKEKQMPFFDRFKKGKKTEPNPTSSQGKSIANTGIAAMIRSGVEQRIAKLPNDESGQTTGSILSRICQPEWLAIISSTLSTKMSDAFQDDELHSLGLSRDGIYVLMYAFPCSPKHALKTVYKNGYAHYIGNAVTDWLRDSLTGVATLLHVQLFSDANSLSLHLTVFPVQVHDLSMVVFPAELLTTNDRSYLAQLKVEEKRGTKLPSLGKRDVCGKCGTTLAERLKWWNMPAPQGVVRVGSERGLFLYCNHCRTGICGGCSIDLGMTAGCPFCETELVYLDGTSQ